MIRMTFAEYTYTSYPLPWEFTIKYNGVVYIPVIPACAKSQYPDDAYIFWSLDEVTEFLDGVAEYIDHLAWSDPMANN